MRSIADPLLCSLLSLTAGLASGQSDGAAGDIITDRPDQTESSQTVPRGLLQIETGWLRAEDTEHGSGNSTEAFMGSLVRIGLSHRLELRIGWQGLVEIETRSQTSNGSGDGELGLKWHLWSENKARPDAALLVGTSVPFGSTSLTSRAWDPAFRFSFSHQLSNTTSLAYNLGYAWETEQRPNDSSRRNGAALGTIVFGFAISKRLGAFVESFATLPTGSSWDPDASLDGGFTWLLKPNLQLDLYGGIGLTPDAPDRLIGVGLSVRLPN